MHGTYEIPKLTADFGDAAGEISACREDCALFDFSFVLRARIHGKEANDVVAAFANRPVAAMRSGKVFYALRLREDGTVKSDLTVWKFADGQYEVMSGHAQDIEDLRAIAGDLMIDLSGETAIFAVQGPNAFAKLAPLCANPTSLAELGYFEHAALLVGGKACLVGRLGYTGEAGFELICSRSDGPDMWEMLSAHVRPAGFIAADTLRIEAGFPLLWNDFAVPVGVVEAGLQQFSASHAEMSQTSLTRICFSAAPTGTSLAMWRFEHPPTRPTNPGELAVTSACFSARVGGTLGLGYMLERDGLRTPQLNDQAGLFQNIRIQEFAALRSLQAPSEAHVALTRRLMRPPAR